MTVLPPPRVLHATLRKITERLARELARPTNVAPDWSDLEWQLARAVAAMHGVSPLLATRLKWTGPQGWKSFLDTQRAHVAARHRRIEDLLEQLNARCCEEKIAPVGLKGTALHAQGLYHPGDRPMADIDLLVRPRDAGRTAQVIESLGYTESFANWKHKVFTPRVCEVYGALGEHERNYLKIELHERIAEKLPLRITDVTESVFPPRPHPGLNTYPSKASLLIHLAIHAASAMAYRQLRLLHLHDIALVSAKMSAVDWDQLLLHGRDCGGPWWALPPLQLTARYYDSVIPQDVLADLTNYCPWALRRTTQRRSISDSSFSYIWIEAFPGIAWCRSLTEAMEYVRTRVHPSKQMLQQRKYMAESQVALSHSNWVRSSQAKRMLLWVRSPQVRVDSLHAMRSVLGRPS
jgi:Uncharacterised nucleotidyltransferase